MLYQFNICVRRLNSRHFYEFCYNLTTQLLLVHTSEKVTKTIKCQAYKFIDIYMLTLTAIFATFYLTYHSCSFAAVKQSKLLFLHFFLFYLIYSFNTWMLDDKNWNYTHNSINTYFWFSYSCAFADLWQSFIYLVVIFIVIVR